jgi:hypothetical protein
VSIAAAVVAATTFISPEVAYFPGDLFDSEAKLTLQRRAMERWPGPAQIVELWESEELAHEDRMAILLGAAASHDPTLLPVYRKALTSLHPRLRMAAAYGYRDLLGDALPNIGTGVDREAGRRLAAEVDAVARTLRVKTLTEFWLQAALAVEGKSMPGWTGAVMRRSPGICLNAVEKVVVFEDFEVLAAAYRIAERPGTRAGLLRLLEAVTMRQFYVKPNESTAGWGLKNMNEGLAAADDFLDLWLDRRCTRDIREILTVSFAALGARGVDPLGTDSWELWLRVLKQGTPAWRMMASRRLYELGGRWSNLSMFHADSESQVKARDDLVSWYRLLPTQVSDRSRPPQQL